MIIVLKPGTKKEDVDRVQQMVKKRGLTLTLLKVQR